MRRAARICVLAVVAVLMAASSAAADPDVVAQWHLDTAAAGLTPDASGNANDGTLSGGATLNPGGRFDNALDLADPGDSSVQVADAVSLRPQTLTVMAWVKGSATATYQYVIGKGATGCGGPSSYAIDTGASGGLFFYVYDGTSFYGTADAGTGIWDGQWHAVAGTFDGSAVRLFVDGAEVGSAVPASGPLFYGQVNTQLRIGNYPNSSSCAFPYVFPGQIDEVRLYDRALTATELTYLQRADHVVAPELPIPVSSPGTPGSPGQPGPPALPPPVEGRNVDVVTVSGTVLVRVPGSRQFVPLPAAGLQLPVGAEVDVTKGRVRMVAATAPMGLVTKTADFYGGIFKVTQPASGKGRVDVTLTGALGHCSKFTSRAARLAKTKKAKAKSGPKSRFVWGDGEGAFRTVGQSGSAAVRGTKWEVQDRCDGSTLVVVARGIVAVTDNVKHKTVLVKAGHSYLIRPHR